MTEILVSWYRPDGTYRGQQKMEVGRLSLVQEHELLKFIIDNQTQMDIGWQGYLWMVTDIYNQRLENFRGFHSKIFKPNDLTFYYPHDSNPLHFVKNVKKSDYLKGNLPKINYETDEYLLGEPQIASGDASTAKMRRAGYYGLYRRLIKK